MSRLAVMEKEIVIIRDCVVAVADVYFKTDIFVKCPIIQYDGAWRWGGDFEVPAGVELTQHFNETLAMKTPRDEAKFILQRVKTSLRTAKQLSVVAMFAGHGKPPVEVIEGGTVERREYPFDDDI